MVKASAYDWMYRVWAPWDSDTARKDLLDLLERKPVGPDDYPRSVDLGCGTGASVVHLAGLGFDAHGVDFSQVAIGKARERAIRAGVDATFVVGDLTSAQIEGLEGQFDLLTDFGTLDDLRGEAREAMAETITRLSRPGSIFLEYCFYGETETLPRFSFSGTSRYSHIAPGELDSLFGHAWDIEPFNSYPNWDIASFLLTRR